MRIVYIGARAYSRGPHGAAELERRRAVLQGWAMSGCEVSAFENDEGPLSIESSAEEYLAVPGILRNVQRAEHDGYDAIMLGCFGDPGVDACREISRIPILTPGQSSMLVAASLSHRFAIVTPLASLRRVLEQLAKAVGIDSKLAGIRSAEVPVLELADDPDRSFRRVVEAARLAITQDGADTIILGCMSMAFLGVSDRLQSELGVPVVNPAQVTLKFAEMLVQSKLAPSKLAYPTPPKPLAL